jgi:hypothetical protein
MSEAEVIQDQSEYELDTSWMDHMGEWGMHAEPGKRGLTLEEIRIGSYGELPQVSDNMSGHPRGAGERPDAYRVGGYGVRSLAEIWLDNATYLWEEALNRQWSSATDIPWETVEPLPDEVEEAECLLCTFFNEVEFVAGDVPARWIAQTTPDYLEPRQVLLAQVMDEARHMDVFRKRALANGGGLMRMSGATSGFVGSIDLARDFTEMSTRLHISGEGAVLSMFRMGELFGQNEAEKRMYRLCAQDEARHVAFGVMHLRYLNEACPERREEIHSYLDEAEAQIMAGLQNPAGTQAETSEALAILLGGSKDNYDEGHKKLLVVRRRQLKEYMQRVKTAGFGDRFEDGRSTIPAQYAAAQ